VTVYSLNTNTIANSSSPEPGIQEIITQIENVIVPVITSSLSKEIHTISFYKEN
jgi:hypothetical protein